MVNKHTSESDRQQAQDLAYKAMSTQSPEEAVRLCTQAIELDPRCVDALTLMAGAYEKLDEQIRHLSRVVQIAEEDLGGEGYFEENEGHFWGLIETRPYMRARSYLAQTLALAGDKNAAIEHYEDLLDLNPGDNQGIRYVLIGLYLETDDVNGVSDLLDEYQDDASAVFAWSLVLERLISGDPDGAESALAEARKANPYVEGYLLGRKALPREMPDYYGIGDESEAIMCMDTIGDAWKRHSEAMRWLRARESTAQAPTRHKVGRNDPCPCGSGKKYKKCCLARDEAAPQPAVGTPVAAEMALSDMMRDIRDQKFSSKEELDALISGYNDRRSQRPVDDFEGLSSQQMHKLMNFPFESPDLIEFPSVLDNPPSAPIVTLFSMLVDAIGEDGLKPTATGNLPRKVVQDIALLYWGEEKYQEETNYASIRSEDDFYQLNVTRLVAGLAGLVRRYKGRFILSRKCRDLMKQGGMRAVYPVLFRALMARFNWGYMDRYPETGIVQTLSTYTLYLLTRYGNEWRANTFYEDAFLRAYPSILDVVEPRAYESREEVIRGMYSLRCFRRFAEFAGLMEIDHESEERYGRVFKMRKTPLLSDVARFRV